MILFNGPAIRLDHHWQRKVAKAKQNLENELSSVFGLLQRLFKCQQRRTALTENRNIWLKQDGGFSFETAVDRVRKREIRFDMTQKKWDSSEIIRGVNSIWSSRESVGQNSFPNFPPITRRLRGFKVKKAN